MMVSEDPNKTDAVFPAKLSAPYFSKSSEIIALEALPEIGRIMTSGRISDGIPIFSQKGEIFSAKKSTMPDAESIDTETIKIIRVGNRFVQILMPFRVPSRKLSKEVFFEKSNAAPVMTMIPQMTAEAISSNFIPPFRF